MNAGPRPSAHSFLLDQVMMVREGGYLRQMGDAEDLVRSGQALELLAYGLGSPATDSSINFVEDQRALRS